jgi:predicted lipid carrier protein YhbT
MSASSPGDPRTHATLLAGIANRMVGAIPVALLQPILNAIGAHIARQYPDLFQRLGPHAYKRFLIEPSDLPFGLVLAPDPARPVLEAYRQPHRPLHDCCIRGRFLDLFGMMDGTLDGDALFFARDLRITGDTEAVVALRNALDDLEGGLMNSIAGAFGPLAKPADLTVAGLRSLRRRYGHA